MSAAPRFVSEPIRPSSPPVSASALAAGAPSLPEGFTWRGMEHRIAEVLGHSKVMDEESFSGQSYVRRHRYRLRMEDGAVWTVYFVRHPPRSGTRSPKAPRWYLQTIEEATGRYPG